MRVSEIDLDTCSFDENFVAVHLPSLVVSHCFTHSCRLSIEHRGEAVDDGLGCGVVHLGQYYEPSRTLDQRADRRAIAGALDQVALSVTRNEAVLYLWRADMNGYNQPCLYKGFSAM